MNGERDPLNGARHDLESSAPIDVAPSTVQTARRRWIVPAGGLVAAAAVIAGAVIGSGVLERSVGHPIQSQTPMSEGPMPSSTAAALASLEPSEAPPSLDPSPSPTPTPTTTGFDISWEEGDWAEDAVVADVMYDDARDQWLAVGGHSIWSSSDGGSWSHSTIESAGCEEPEDHCAWAVHGIEPLGNRLIALGLIASSGSDATFLVSWVSDDGRSWTLSSSAGTTAQGPTSAEANGVVLLTTPDQTTPEGGTAFNTTRDGATWESSYDSDGTKIFDVYGDEAGFVGVGIAFTVRDDGYDTQPIVRVSADGLSWQTATIGEVDAGGLWAIERLPSGRYIGAGVARNGQIVLWASNDADEPWTETRLGTPREVSGTSSVGTMVALAGGDAGVMLAWNLGDGLMIATTADGDRWRQTNAPADSAETMLSTIEMTGDRVLAFGGTRNPDNGLAPGAQFGAWLGTLTPTTD